MKESEGPAGGSEKENVNESATASAIKKVNGTMFFGSLRWYCVGKHSSASYTVLLSFDRLDRVQTNIMKLCCGPDQIGQLSVKM